MNAPRAPALDLRGLTVRYGSRAALTEVTVEVPVGQFVALVGPNGSGKSTLLRAVLGFLGPASGTVRVFGRDVAELTIRERARRVAWVPQEETPRDNVPLLEYVLYGRYSHLGPLEGESSSDRESARVALAGVGLADRADDGILEVSGGERQRAVLARALVQEAPLLLLDEPTAHLDIGHQLDLLGRVQRLTRDRGVTAVAALHDINLAARFADRIVVLSHGRVFEDGRPTEVLSEELLLRVWGVVADLRHDPRSGLPYLVPFRPSPGPGVRRVRGGGPVHVVGGGGAASPYLSALFEAGFRLTAGALNLLDTDSETAERLGIPVAAEVPFAPIGPEAREQNRAMIRAAVAVVVAPTVIGPSNLSNLEDLGEVVGRVPVLIVRQRAGTKWDFSGGRATSLRGELVRAGAEEVGSEREIVERLSTRVPAPVH